MHHARDSFMTGTLLTVRILSLGMTSSFLGKNSDHSVMIRYAHHDSNPEFSVKRNFFSLTIGTRSVATSGMRNIFELDYILFLFLLYYPARASKGACSRVHVRGKDKVAFSA